MGLPRGIVVLAAIGVAAAVPLQAGSALAPPVFAVAAPTGSITGTGLGAATELETGDLNGDGLPDVVITRLTVPPTHVTHPIGILLANGHGGFVDGSSMWDGPPARTEWGRQIIIADFNGDHRNDIFVADHGYDAEPFPGHPNTLVLSTPAGKLVDASANIPPESGFTHSAAAADVDGDGDIDIYVGNLCCGDGSPPEILLNDGTGHFTSRRDLLPSFLLDNYGPHQYTRSLFVDLNGDHAPDLVLGGSNDTPDSRVLLNDGTGHFHDAPAPLPAKAFGPDAILISLATLDVNSDGKADLIAGFQRKDFSGRRLEILIGNGDGTFRDETSQRLTQQQEGQAWPYAIRVADFNGDGHLDFVVDTNSGGLGDTSTAIYLDDGTGTYHMFPFTPANWLFGVVDANGDGYPDIVSSGIGDTTEPHDIQLQLVVPSAPTGLRASGTATGVRLAWKRSTGAGVAYEVWRSTGSTAKKRLATTTAPTFLDRTAKRAVVYRYVVRGLNGAGAGPFSAPAAARRR